MASFGINKKASNIIVVSSMKHKAAAISASENTIPVRLAALLRAYAQILLFAFKVAMQTEQRASAPVVSAPETTLAATLSASIFDPGKWIQLYHKYGDSFVCNFATCFPSHR
ncbi:OLC1v1008070C1 [Oldenlandia corymbosa var. corymbosa]|uniref:OLC1v1008070C1 n=1 Tax=Oldenlandia corymbosa var. corymbosa TaxID=529605 RepID=A0AAV1DN76_OLDCO|nr:OLC1v1008070C1 [Oldenlandia corymbosa var. corymbosa]